MRMKRRKLNPIEICPPNELPEPLTAKMTVHRGSSRMPSYYHMNRRCPGHKSPDHLAQTMTGCLDHTMFGCHRMMSGRRHSHHHMPSGTQYPAKALCSRPSSYLGFGDRQSLAPPLHHTYGDRAPLVDLQSFAGGSEFHFG